MKTWIRSIMPKLLITWLSRKKKGRPILKTKKESVVKCAFALLSLDFVNADFSNLKTPEDVRKYDAANCSQHRKYQRDILDSIIEIEGKPNSNLKRAYIILRQETDRTARGTMAELDLQQQLSVVHKNYLSFATKISHGADDECTFYKEIRGIIESNLQTLEDMKNRPNTYNLLLTTFEEVAAEGSLYSFPRLKVVRMQQ